MRSSDVAKGGTFEREVCYQLSRWWTGSRKELVFWRTSNSGGGATVRHRKGVSNKAHAGDITATEETARPFTSLVTLELKVGYNKKKGSQGSIHDLFDRVRQRTMYEEWIVQAETAAENAGSPFWMIVHRRDHRHAMAYFPSRLYALLTMVRCFERMPVPFLATTVWVRDGISAKIMSVVGMRFDWFLGAVDPDDVRRLQEDKSWVRGS